MTGCHDTQDVLDDAIGRLGELPILRPSVQRVVALAADPAASTLEVVTAIEQDSSLAVNLLRYVNTAHHARRVRANTLHQAVTLLGRRAVGRLALEATVCEFLERRRGTGVVHGRLQIHAVQVAVCAAELAHRARADMTGAHLAGLLHDVGKLVLPEAFGADRVEELVALAGSGAERVILEREELGTDHAEAGARFGAVLGLEPSLVEAIRCHHDGAEDDAALTACVQAANCLVALSSGFPADMALLARAKDRLGLAVEDLEASALIALPAPRSIHRPPALAREVARVEREARTDALTGLLNRRYWMLAAREWLDAATGADAGAVLLCDVDEFKSVNDVHGHESGDVVLVKIARILDRHGVAGRLGGDEFVVAVPPSVAAEDVAAEILRDVAAAFADGGVQVSISIGAATAGGASQALGDLLRAADQALYDAKAAGRATFRVGAPA